MPFPLTSSQDHTFRVFHFKTAKCVLRSEAPLTFLQHCVLSLGERHLFYYSEFYEWHKYFILLVAHQSLVYIIKL